MKKQRFLIHSYSNGSAGECWETGEKTLSSLKRELKQVLKENDIDLRYSIWTIDEENEENEIHIGEIKRNSRNTIVFEEPEYFNKKMELSNSKFEHNLKYIHGQWKMNLFSDLKEGDEFKFEDRKNAIIYKVDKRNHPWSCDLTETRAPRRARAGYIYTPTKEYKMFRCSQYQKVFIFTPYTDTDYLMMALDRKNNK